jgi:hypothetical protein
MLHYKALFEGYQKWYVHLVFTITYKPLIETVSISGSFGGNMKSFKMG